MGFTVEIKKWHAIASWTWDAGDDVCGICRNPFDGCPPDGKFPGDDSTVVRGVCGHAFHLQCIQKWLGVHKDHRCPICRQAWEFKFAKATGKRGSWRKSQEVEHCGIDARQASLFSNLCQETTGICAQRWTCGWSVHLGREKEKVKVNGALRTT